MSPQPKVFRDEIHNFVRACEEIVSANLSPDSPRFSKEERAVIESYLEELHQLLKKQKQTHLG